jgi:membrane associated rhomboid family serine protease
MLIPLGTDRPLQRPTVITWALIVLCAATYAMQLLAGWLTDEGRARIASEFAWRADPFHWWTPVTYAFMHGDWWHLAGNMLFLWVFGPNIEDRFGRIGFLVFYLLGAVVSGGLQVLMAGTGVIGASGAIAACTGAYLIMFPRTTVKAFSLLFVIGLVAVPAWWFIGLSVVWDLIAQGSGQSRGIAHLAHLGGYAFGAGVSFVLLWMKVLPREPYDVFSMSRQAYRRKQIRDAVGGQKRAMEKRWERAREEEKTKGRGAEDAPRNAAVAEARAEIARMLSNRQVAEAAAAYKRLADEQPAAGGLTTLSRKNQYELANHFFTTGDQAAAVYAYERCLEMYPRDPEAPHIRLLLGRVNARYLNDPVRAKAFLTEAIAGLRDDESRAMARRELEALG